MTILAVFFVDGCFVRHGGRPRRALGIRRRWAPGPVKAEPVEELRKQADIAVRVLTVFRGAALLLDEVGFRCNPKFISQLFFFVFARILFIFCPPFFLCVLSVLCIFLLYLCEKNK